MHFIFPRMFYNIFALKKEKERESVANCAGEMDGTLPGRLCYEQFGIESKSISVLIALCALLNGA